MQLGCNSVLHFDLDMQTLNDDEDIILGNNKLFESGCVSFTTYNTLWRAVPGINVTTLHILHAKNKAYLKILKGHTEEISSTCTTNIRHQTHSTLAINSYDKPLAIPDGLLFISGSFDNTIRIWDITKPSGKECVRILKGHTNGVTSLHIIYNDNGNTNGNNLLISESWDYTRRIWDIITGDCLYVLPDMGEHINSVYVSKNLMIDYTHDYTIQISDIKSKKSAQVLVGHTATITAIYVKTSKYDDKMITSKQTTLGDDLIISCSRDGTIRIWNINSGKCIKTLQSQHIFMIYKVWLYDNLIGLESLEKIEIIPIVVFPDETKTICKVMDNYCLSANLHGEIFKVLGIHVFNYLDFI